MVYAAISDELTQGYRKYGALIPPSKVPQVIEHLPLTVPASKQMAGYLIVGLEDNEEEPAKELFELFGATPPPEDLKQLSQTLEPVYIKSLVEMKETIFAISNANARSRAASEDKRDKVFLRELKREVVELASQYAMRRKNNTREPDVAIPGVDYYILALDPNLARIYKLLEGVLREPVQIQRTPPELMFKNPDRFVKVLQIIQETTKNASEGEIMRRLTVEAALLDDEDDED